jgi:hypothetical protein
LASLSVQLALLQDRQKHLGLVGMLSLTHNNSLQPDVLAFGEDAAELGR